jgi:hypothetical protein
MKFQVGKVYRTRGGWKALCIWEATMVYASTQYYFIHKPKESDESGPILHCLDGMARTVFSVCEIPYYGNNPADIVSDEAIE